VLACLMLIAFGSTSSAQVFEQIEILPDGSRIIKIDGAVFRAITPAKVEELANQKDELRVCKVNETRFNDLLTIERQNVTIAQQQTSIERGNFVRATQLLEKERELRQKAMEFAPVSGTPKGFGGWLLKAVNSPYGAVAFKLVLPAATFIKTLRN